MTWWGQITSCLMLSQLPDDPMSINYFLSHAVTGITRWPDEDKLLPVSCCNRYYQMTWWGQITSCQSPDDSMRGIPLAGRNWQMRAGFLVAHHDGAVAHRTRLHVGWAPLRVPLASIGCRVEAIKAKVIVLVNSEKKNKISNGFCL